MSSSSSDMWRLVQKATKIPAGFLLTSSVSLDNNKDVLKSIKAACRTEGTVAVKELMRSLLLTLTTTKTVGVKGRVLAIMDEMFWRSREFREETSAHLRVIAKHLRLLENSSRSNITTSNSGSSSSSNNSSSSSGHAGGGIGAAGAVVEDAFLQNKLKQLIVLWDGCYGQCLPELRGVVRYLSEAMKVPLPDMNVRVGGHQEISCLFWYMYRHLVVSSPCLAIVSPSHLIPSRRTSPHRRCSPTTLMKHGANKKSLAPAPSFAVTKSYVSCPPQCPISKSR